MNRINELQTILALIRKRVDAELENNQLDKVTDDLMLAAYHIVEDLDKNINEDIIAKCNDFRDREAKRKNTGDIRNKIFMNIAYLDGIDKTIEYLRELHE